MQNYLKTFDKQMGHVVVMDDEEEELHLNVKNKKRKCWTNILT